MKEELIQYGLSEKEAEVYLTALQIGEATANTLAKQTHINRITIYDTAKSLEQKGLISTYKKEKKTYFCAKPAETFIQQIQEKQELIEQILPKLQQITNTKTQDTQVTVYKGKVGLRTAAEEMLQTKEILVYGGGIKADEVFNSYTANFAKRRIEKKITLKTIIGTTIPEHMKEEETSKYTPIRQLHFMNEFETTYFIYNNNLLIWNYGNDLIAIKMTSKTITQTQKKLFEFLWKTAKQTI